MQTSSSRAFYDSVRGSAPWKQWLPHSLPAPGHGCFTIRLSDLPVWGGSREWTSTVSVFGVQFLSLSTVFSCCGASWDLTAVVAAQPSLIHTQGHISFVHSSLKLEHSPNVSRIAAMLAGLRKLSPALACLSLYDSVSQWPATHWQGTQLPSSITYHLPVLWLSYPQ